MNSVTPYTRGYTFEVYRPDRISSRLEPVLTAPKEGEWYPSLHYKHSLRDIQTQYTPSEYYRHRLKTSGAYIRLIQRLELRWSRNLDRWTHSATTIQRVYRGVRGRRYFSEVKEMFYDDMLRRKYTKPAINAYEAGDYELSLDLIGRTPPPIGESLQQIRIKCLYRLKRFDACILESLVLRELNPLSSDSYYFHALSLARESRINEAFEVARNAILQITSCDQDVFRLTAGLAVQVHPPNFDIAIDAYGELLRRDAKDFNALLARASCYCCLQDWSEALVDIQNILAFQPVHRQALLLRARIHSCNRRWAEAEKDYNSILYFEPHHEEAVQGMKETKKFDPEDVLHIEH